MASVILCNGEFPRKEYPLWLLRSADRIICCDASGAVTKLEKMGLEPAPFNCLQTEEVNAGMCEGTPWTSTVEHIGPDHCVQIFRKEPSK